MIFGYKESARCQLFFKHYIDQFFHSYPPFSQLSPINVFQRHLIWGEPRYEWAYWERSILDNLFLAQKNRELTPAFFHQGQQILTHSDIAWKVYTRMQLLNLYLYEKQHPLPVEAIPQSFIKKHAHQDHYWRKELVQNGYVLTFSALSQSLSLPSLLQESVERPQKKPLLFTKSPKHQNSCSLIEQIDIKRTYSLKM